MSAWTYSDVLPSVILWNKGKINFCINLFLHKFILLKKGADVCIWPVFLRCRKKTCCSVSLFIQTWPYQHSVRLWPPATVGISVLNHCLEWDKFVRLTLTYPTPDSGLTYTRRVPSAAEVSLYTPEIVRVDRRNLGMATNITGRRPHWSPVCWLHMRRRQGTVPKSRDFDFCSRCPMPACAVSRQRWRMSVY